MCVIISRKPRVEIPSGMIESACFVNADGYGYSVIDRGKVETFKEYDKDGNDPDKILKVLEDAKDQHVYVHLRYTTRGAKDAGNCHPFPVTTLKGDGLDSFFMHNGTLSKFNDSINGRSDSFVFARDLLAPMAQVFNRGCVEESFLKNSTFARILGDYATGSVFCLYDMDGNELIIDTTKQGKNYDGWWASNTYSFDRWHRTQKGFQDYRYGSTGSGQCVVPFKGEDKKSTTTGSSSGADEQPTLSLSEQCEVVGEAVNKLKQLRKAAPVHTPPSRRHTFVELSGMDSLKSIELLAEEEIEDLVDQTPEAATLLILDLIYELYTQKKMTIEAQIKAANA